MERQLQSNIQLGASAFRHSFIFSQSVYLHLFGKLPSSVDIRQVDYHKTYTYMKTEFADLIESETNSSNFHAHQKKEEAYHTVIILKNEIIVELGETYCEIFYNDKNKDFVDKLKKNISVLRKRSKKPLEINLITVNEGDLELNKMEVKRTRLDLSLYYEDNFKEVDAVIRKRLNKKKDKGIILLHGLPGTGKTTYLRYLIGKIKKTVIFVPPNIAGEINKPELVKLLIDNPDSVLIIEDAENIIMQRQAGYTSSVSNLLNISDGLLSDFLNIQLICTFNSNLSSIDNALTRKGRLIARYEFGKLSVKKAEILAKKMGKNININTPMSLAEIMNYSETQYEQQPNRIGFRQNAELAE